MDKYKKLAELWIDEVEDPSVASCYLFKLGKRKKVLFEKGVMTRYTYSIGSYFFRNKKEFSKEKMNDFIVRKFEDGLERVMSSPEEKARWEAENSTKWD